MRRVKKEQLPDFQGESAYNGALRFFDLLDTKWVEEWRDSYADLLPNLKFFAADAFGVLYGLNNQNQVCIFWTETGELEYLAVDQEEFFGIIAEDPDGTINRCFFEKALIALGKPSIKQDFAFKVEIALGGQISIDNLYICDRNKHLSGLGKVARQIKNMPLGTKINVSIL